MYTCRESRENAYARRHAGWRSRAAAAASRSARAAALPSRATIFSATSRPVFSSRASQTDPEPPLPSGRNGRYRSRTSPAPSNASAALDMGLPALAAGRLFPLWPDSGLVSCRQRTAQELLSTHDDDIEFDFFDEPETVEATQRRR